MLDQAKPSAADRVDVEALSTGGQKQKRPPPTLKRNP
jgi:hypothetical protein